MQKQKLIENIFLNENAYFYEKETRKFVPKNLIKKTFQQASIYKKGNFLLKELKTKFELSNGKHVFYSIAVFKYGKKPTFIDKPVTGWEETKLAYICMVDFKSHLVIAKRNISGIRDFLELFYLLTTIY